ncbi:MucR family transcriptional regulator [Desulfobacca acetoxidans]|jgi:predicted transcriptional regulator|uniref:Transcriptional regulator, MucR family n=1 Tax=Desulfobacca acetoxidans (strain ATCC 700848 / DSM 11109 / ASRB2) TaxID=880072 RepID=F2NEL8_DESAR|nr:MucR family transcriptional regulator [Desulfobacca acetoxidans]AEB08208.1 transcriptional regulator, MucR family [Desulfobacca acetoxidans DSM 11109]HAY22308.1 MucR family transcriptional regulator [Desulfobacterales bacterium]
MATELLKMTAQIITSHASISELSSQELISEIKSVYNTLAELAGEAATAPSPEVTPTETKGMTGLKPAIPVEESLQDDYIVCLECGQKFKTLKAHLRRAHQMTPADYYERFGLDAKKYPLVSRNYSEQRRQLAKEKGLGDFRRSKKV